MPLALVVVLDILVGGLVILTFAFFHHVLPAINTERTRQEQLLLETEPVVIQTMPQIVETEPQKETQAPTEATEPPATEPDNRTEWQIKFAEHFSDEIRSTQARTGTEDMFHI